MKRIALVTGILLCGLIALAVADDAARCTVSESAGSIGKVDGDSDFFDNDSGNCCRNLSTFKCDDPSHISPAVLAGKRNIVLVIADDQGYCQYGFMHGYCGSGSGQGRTGKTCRSNIDCAGGECLRRDSGDGIDAGDPLRLSDFTCRYRQPPVESDRSTKSCKYGTHPDRLGAKGGDKNSFPFHASNFPCTTTYEGGTVPANPVPLTPYLDQLATHGAVFTRAYLGGNACKSSRPVILYGKPHRHLLEMDEYEEDRHSIASWLLDNANSSGQHQPESGPGAQGYWPFMLGKAEVMSETSAGFKGGLEKSKPKLAKYHCGSPGNCQTAAEATTGSDFLKVPAEARAATHGIGDALNVVEGRRGIHFSDLSSAIERTDVEGTNDTDCTACQNDHGASGCNASQCGSQLMKPFFLWVAPNQPHKRGRGDDYHPLYPDLEERDLKHSARITQMDQAVGTLIDELKRHCVCGRELDAAGDPVDPTNEQKQSLWEHTVLIYLADHGFMLPDAKRNDTENTQRTVLLVSEPKHRMKDSGGSPVLEARQYEHELVHAIDVFRTVLDYADLPFTESDKDPIEPGVGSTGYRFGRSLKSWVSNSSQPTNHIRDVVYGEDAEAGELTHDVVRGHDRNRYLVTRPGLLGVCLRDSDGAEKETGLITYNFNTSYQKRHVKPCLIEGGNDCGSGYSCLDQGRCINDPSKACTGNSDCIESDFCSSGTCVYDADGSLGDVARPVVPTSGADAPSKACPSGASQCVPAAVSLCQHPVLKVKAHASTLNTGVIDSVWDLNWDPDELHNLWAEDNYYLGDSSDTNSLSSKITTCLNNYWNVDVTGGTLQWQGTYGSSGCTWTETALP